MRLRVATLNVWALPPPLGRQVPERIEAIGAQLPALQLDVVGFQEVWTGAARHTLLEAGRRAGLIYSWHRARTLGGSGLLVLSRFPLRGARFVPYALGGLPEELTQLDYYGGKGFASLELETPAGPITAIDTHLQARYGSQVPHEYRGHRTGQLVQLAGAVRRTERPLVILGDFNFKPRHPEYSIWVGLSGATDVAAALGAEAPTIFSGNPYRSHSSPRRIDYVFARDGASRGWRLHESRRVFDGVFPIDGRLASFSDHAGALAELELAPGPGSLPPVRAEAVERALGELSAGRARAESRRAERRAWAGSALAVAGLGAASLRTSAVSRRGFLRGAVRAAALATALPGLGSSAFSELWTPEELGAFAEAHRELARLAGAGRAVAGSAAELEAAAFDGPARRGTGSRPL